MLNEAEIGSLINAYARSSGRPQRRSFGSALDPTKLGRAYMRPAALGRAEIVKPFRPWHDLRHTALTFEAAACNPAVTCR